MITIDVVSAAAQKRFSRYDIEGMPKIIGVDIARFGDDCSVIQRRQGLCALKPIVMQRLDNMEVVGRLTAQISEWYPDQVFIDAGRGEGVIDRVRQLGYPVDEHLVRTPFADLRGEPPDYLHVVEALHDDRLERAEALAAPMIFGMPSIGAS